MSQIIDAQSATPSEEKRIFEGDGFRDFNYVVDHIKIPEDPSQCPDIYMYIAPTRSGTTAMLGPTSNHEGISQVYFQPFKALLRHGEPEIVLRAGTGAVFMKETFGPLYPEENFDPIAMLLSAGVPAEKIKCIFALRNPVDAFASTRKYVEEVSPEIYESMQTNTVNLFKRYKGIISRSIPFIYDLFENNEEEVMRSLFSLLGLGDSVDLNFHQEIIEEKLKLGEACNPAYYKEIVEPTFARSRFEVRRSNEREKLDPAEVEAVETLCRSEFSEFFELALDQFFDWKKKVAVG